MTSLAITPPTTPFDNVSQPPGSKSHTIRALFVAAAAAGVSTLSGALDSDDTRHARNCLRLLGARILEDGDTWTVTGVAGRFTVPQGPLHAGESGLTARFLMGMAPHIPAHVEITGSGRLPERPMGVLLDNLAGRGVTVTHSHPWRIDAGGARRDGDMAVDASASSQMVSSLLLAAPLGGGPTTLEVEGMRSSAEYVDITVETMRAFGARVEETKSGYRVAPGGYTASSYTIPTDASAMVYPACAAAITGGRVEVVGNPGRHPDRRIFEVLKAMGCHVGNTESGIEVVGPDRLSPVEVDMSSAPDAAVGLAVVCARAVGPSRIAGLESLRLKESDRLEAIRSELSKYGTAVGIEGDSLVIEPATPVSARFDTHNDHRIAMALALLGLVEPGVIVENPGVVDKTWPDYWGWLSSTGAGVTPI